MRMKLLAIMLCIVFSFPALAIKEMRGAWIGSGGFGVALGPTLMVISPQLEYVYREDFHFGVMSQIGFGAGGALFTGGGTVRYIFAKHGKMFPTIEGGIGLTLSSGVFDQSIGVHLLTGFGVDMEIDDKTAVGTMIRLNFAPPLKSMFVTWPLLIGRFLL